MRFAYGTIGAAILGGVVRHAISGLLVLWCMAASAQPADVGMAICYEAEKAINGLVDYTNTNCLPSKGKAGAQSFLVISDEPVFSNPASQKGWVIGVVGVIGKVMNSRPKLAGDEIWMSDMNQTKNRVAYVIPVSLAKSLQRRAYDGEINIEQMYAEIQKNLVKKTTAK
jgi:hypothetical protein